MHFRDAWTELTLLELFRLLSPLALSLAALLLPKPREAALAAALAPLSLTVWPGRPHGAGLPLLWFLGSTLLGLAVLRLRPPSASRPPLRAAAEMLVLGLALLLAWAGVLVAGLAQQTMAPVDARDATVGVALIAIGMAHLLWRRDLVRAALALLSLGLGVGVLESVARGALPAALAHDAGSSVLACTLAGALLALRVAVARARVPGAPWVTDAHDLRD